MRRQCKVCGRNFTSLAWLKFHRSKKHPETVDHEYEYYAPVYPKREISTNIPVGYIEKSIRFLVPTHLGDRFLNKQECDFHETKDGAMMIVTEKQ